MNLLTFNFEYPPLGGGGGVVHELIAEELASRHRIVVITSAFDDLPSSEVRRGVQIYRVPVLLRRKRSSASLVSLLSYPPMAWRVGLKLLRSQEFDLVHSHFAVPTGLGSLPPSRLMGIPHVISLHGGDVYDPSKKLSPHRLFATRSVVSWVLRNSSAVVAQSRNTMENAYRYYSYKGPIELLPLGIKVPEFEFASRSSLGLPENRFLAITVGRLVKRKGLGNLLLSLADPCCESIDLLIIGEGPEAGNLQKLTHELGLAARVKFLGRVEETRKWQLLAVADAYVSAAQHEGFGLVYLEAMCVGLPVVTFDQGGQVDFLEDGETGYLVPVGDIKGLSDALCRLRTNPPEVRRFGEHNLKKAPELQIERCAQRYEDLFMSLIR